MHLTFINKLSSGYSYPHKYPLQKYLYTSNKDAVLKRNGSSVMSVFYATYVWPPLIPNPVYLLSAIVPRSFRNKIAKKLKGKISVSMHGEGASSYQMPPDGATATRARHAQVTCTFLHAYWIIIFSTSCKKWTLVTNNGQPQRRIDKFQ